MKQLNAALAAGATHLRLGAFAFVPSERITLNRPVLIEGAGMGRTTIKLNSAWTAGTKPGDDVYGVAVFSSDVHFRDLTLHNVATTSALTGVVRGHWGARNERCSFERVEFRLGNGRPVNLTSPVDLKIRECRFLQDAASEGPLTLASGMRNLIQRNTFRWNGNRLRFLAQAHSSFVDNEFTVTGTWEGETGGVETGWGYDTHLDRNRGTLLKARTLRDGEGYTSQISIYKEFSAAGDVVGSNGTTVSTTLRRGRTPWTVPNIPALENRKALYVLEGKAAGQWRWVTEASDGTYRMDRPLDGLARGDRIAVGSCNAYGMTYRGNVMKGWSTAIQLYQGGLKCALEDNVVTNGGGILLRAEAREKDAPGYYPVWDCTLRRNKVTGTGRLPANVVAFATAIGTQGEPNLVRGTVLEDNVASGPIRARGQFETTFDGFVGVGSNSELGGPGVKGIVQGTVRKGTTTPE